MLPGKITMSGAHVSFVTPVSVIDEAIWLASQLCHPLFFEIYLHGIAKSLLK
jgi:hypothetical protein